MATHEIRMKSMRPWQEYLLSKCRRDNMSDLGETKYQSAQWRYADYNAFLYDVMECNGPIAAVALSMAYKPKTIVEMGVFSGQTSFVLCRANPEATVHGVDNSTSGIMHGTTLPVGHTALTHGVDNLFLYLEQDSWDFAMPGKVDMCFIDAEHCGEAPYKDTLRAWGNRNTSRDWCIAWDDYHPSNPDVVCAVDHFCIEVGMVLRKIASWHYIGTLPHSAVEAFE